MMTKSLFLGIKGEDLKQVKNLKINHLFVVDHEINNINWKELSGLETKKAISMDAFLKGCPANPELVSDILSRVEKAAEKGPDEIWLDGFRFGGRCTSIDEQSYTEPHGVCEYCGSVDRVKFLNELAAKVKEKVPKDIKLGYFAVAFKSEDNPKLLLEMGQDHKDLSQIFDMVSPMLYHRMFGKRPSYISEYVDYLSKKASIPILPIIQAKDMPDSLEDKMDNEEIKQAFNEAIKTPSSGVSIFKWGHVLEKEGLVELLRELFSAS